MDHKHTQEEWEIRGNKIFVKGTYRSLAEGHVINNFDVIRGKKLEDVEAIANLKLMAAAPELLKALLLIINDDPTFLEIKQVAEAIKKAIE